MVWCVIKCSLQVIEHLIKQQYVCAQQVMDQHQFGVFKDGWSNVIVQTSVAGKQAALQQVLVPLPVHSHP